MVEDPPGGTLSVLVNTEPVVANLLMDFRNTQSLGSLRSGRVPRNREQGVREGPGRHGRGGKATSPNVKVPHLVSNSPYLWNQK